MSGKRKSKTNIHMSKPEPPPFLQRIKEQMVATQDSERKEAAERKRKLRPNVENDSDEDPTVVRLGDGDLTEEEYKRIKIAMETQYKLESDHKDKAKSEELDVDSLIKSRQMIDTKVRSTIRPATGESSRIEDRKSKSSRIESEKNSQKSGLKSNIILSYDDDSTSSSKEDDDDDNNN